MNNKKILFGILEPLNFRKKERVKEKTCSLMKKP